MSGDGGMSNESKSKSKLRGMQMPEATTPEQQDLIDQEHTNMGEVDPETGLPLHEDSLEEGDIVMDYAMPIKNLFTGGLKAAAKGGIRAMQSLMPKPGRQNKTPDSPALDYSKINKQVGAGNVTDATTGWTPSKGVKVRDN